MIKNLFETTKVFQTIRLLLYFIVLTFLVPPLQSTEQPIAYWTFDVLENGILKNDANPSFSAKVKSVGNLVEGIKGKAFDCNNHFIEIVPEQISSELKAISVSAWVRPRKFENYQEILRKEDGEKRLLFSFQSSGTILSFGLNVGGKYAECDATIPAGFFDDNGWHFIAATFDGTLMVVYADGSVIGKLKRDGNLSIGGSAPVYIGSSGGTCEFFDGVIDELKIYDRALSEKEIVAIRRPNYILLAESLLQQVNEYRPLTALQRQGLSESEKKRLQDFDIFEKEVRAKIDTEKKAPQQGWPEMIDRLYAQIKTRPVEREAVAPYVPPKTAPVIDLTPQQAEETLRHDWIFQCDGHPTKERILQEIQWTKEVAARIEDSGIDFSTELDELGKLTVKAMNLVQEDSELYFQVRHVKRRILFKNPVIDFNSILYVDMPYPQGSEWRHETRHRLGYMAVPGGRLMTLTGLSPSGKQKKLLPEEPLAGSFWRPDLSFDAKRILVSFKPHNEKSFHLYEIGIDGKNVRQLTGGLFDDFDPIYLPDGQHLAFSTTRGYSYVRCMPPTNAFVLARMKLDSSDLYLISRNNEPDYLPSLLPDGRIVFSRWEYTDKPLWRCVSLWTMNPDGTQTQVLWGNQSVWPDLPKDVRAIPNSQRLMFTGSAHHNWFSGSVGMIDPTKGLNFPDGLTKITSEITWPETGNGPVDPIESAVYHRSGAYDAYDSPYPLSDTDFLVSAHRGGGNDGKYVLLLMDTDGNRELIYEGMNHIFYAQPIRTRPVPPVIVDRVKWPGKEEREKAAPGIIYSNNVYDNAPPELKDKAKYLRILNIEPKTYTLWNQRPYISTGPAVSMVQSEGVKRILGTVPIEKDGSVAFYAPSGVALHFQLLDENGKCLQTMRSFTGVMPGERRGCLGCHASQITTPSPQLRSIAVLREPSKITPPDWNDISVSFERYVQPVLDKHCSSCHSGNGEAKNVFDTTLRPGFLHFKEPYVTLVGNPGWARPQSVVRPGKRNAWNGAMEKELDKEPPGFGIADTILVEAFYTTDPAAYTTPKPMEKLSYASRLVNKYCQPQHYNVKLSPIELQRIIVWVDTMCPYMGSDDIRAEEDPVFQGSDWLAIKPRLKTAPVVRRPGPLDAFGNDEEVYAPPANETIYGNPVVMSGIATSKKSSATGTPINKDLKNVKEKETSKK